MRKKIFTFLAMLAFCVCASYAQTHEAFNPVSKIPITIISLVVVGLLAYFSLTFMGSKNWLPKAQSKNIQVIERQFLTPKHSLFIIKVGDEYILVGATDASINTLKELKKEEMEKRLNSKEEPARVDVKDFWAKFFSMRFPSTKK